MALHPCPGGAYAKPAMALSHVCLERFRLIARAELALAPGINLFLGTNAQGKTSILEAVGYLATGRSFRTSRDRECIAWNAPGDSAFAAIEARLSAGTVEHEVRVALERAGKSVWIDGKALKTLTELWGIQRAVFFAPSDLTIVQGAPGLRRTVMDSLLGQTNPAYLRVLTAANRALQSRNRLLKSGADLSDRQFDALEGTLAEHAARVLSERARLGGELSRLVAQPMEALSEGGERLELKYEPGAWKLGAEQILEAPLPELQEALRRLWRESRERDGDRQMTCEGPHRDDLRFEINGRDARAYASQGQTRSAVLALRLAELDVLSESGARTPVLLLDDILGELDARRAEQFLRLVAERQVQTLITATDAAGIGESLPIAKEFSVHGGTVAER